MNNVNYETYCCKSEVDNKDCLFDYSQLKEYSLGHINMEYDLIKQCELISVNNF